MIEKVHESPPPYTDTGHENPPVIAVIAMTNVSSQNGGTSQSNESSSISIISNACPEIEVVNGNKIQSDNKEDKSIHM